MKNLNKSQISTLLYFETRCVDNCGKVDSRRINKEDVENAKILEEMGLLHFGRIHVDDWEDHTPECKHWVSLTDLGWREAHKQRRARADRFNRYDWANRYTKNDKQADT